MKLFPRLLLMLLAIAPLSACAASPTALVEGEDYELIAEPGPFAPLAGKIEVVEVFGYTCPHCAHFEPQLEAWAAKLPADVVERESRIAEETAREEGKPEAILPRIVEGRLNGFYKEVVLTEQPCCQIIFYLAIDIL